MKFFVSILLCWALTISANPLIFLTPRIGTSCATSDTTLPHDTLLEGWGSGPENTWTSWVGTDTVTYDTAFDSSSLATGKPVGACNTAVQVTVSTTAGDESLFWDRGSAVTIASSPTDFVFYIYVTTTPDDGENFTIVSINTTTTGSGSITTWLNMRNNGGTMEVQCEASTTSAWAALTANSWNKIRIHLDATPASSYFDVNDGSDNAFTYLGTQWRYIHYGAVQNHAINENAVYVLDLVAVEIL